MRNLGIVALCAALGGCAAQANNAAVEDPQGWARVDCQRGLGNPVLEAQLEQAKAICTGRAQAAGLAGTAGMPTGGRNLGDAIGNGIVAGVTQAQITNATASSCMAEQGYLLRTRSSFEAVCTPVWEQQRLAEEAAVKKLTPSARKPPKKPASTEIPKTAGT
jgi:hypothetical protein